MITGSEQNGYPSGEVVRLVGDFNRVYPREVGPILWGVEEQVNKGT
jgi:hypothetical protein